MDLRGSGTGRRHYGWVVVAVTAATLLVSSGVRAAPGVLIPPWEADFGWSRAAVSLAASLGLLLFGLAGPVCGWLVDRAGPRRMMLAGLALMVLSCAASVTMTGLWQLNLYWGLLSGAGTGVAAVVLGATVANRWFDARRGLVVGIFGAATSAGQLLFVPLLMGLVVAGGWRSAVLVLAGAAALAAVPVWLLMRDDPRDVGTTAYGASAREDERAPASPMVAEPMTGAPAVAVRELPRPAGTGMRRAVRTPEFWLLAGSFFVCGASSNGLIGTHFVPHAVEHGVAQVTAASVLAVMGAMNFVGTIASGWLTDRYDPRRLLAVYYAFRGLSLLLLPAADGVTGLLVFAVLFGLDYIATVPPTTALVADVFGRGSVGTVFGWVFCAHQVGAAAAAYAGGWARTAFGDYTLAFLAAGALCAVAAAMALRVRRPVPPAPVLSPASR